MRKETEGRPSITETEEHDTKLTQLIGEVLVDESADETIECDSQPEHA